MLLNTFLYVILNNYVLCMHVLSACICVYHTCIWYPRNRHQILGTEVVNCELLCGN